MKTNEKVTSLAEIIDKLARGMHSEAIGGNFFNNFQPEPYPEKQDFDTRKPQFFMEVAALMGKEKLEEFLRDQLKQRLKACLQTLF
jgi:hypothetical protein